jgi:peptidoglycan/xylan/chitin deacetylase (PgdA/CDA1 family)
MEKILEIFEKNNIVPVVAITATWVDENSKLIPFPEKFPKEAEFLKQAFLQDKIVVANHGLTHCIIGKHLPKFFKSNREFHREFYSRMEQTWHDEHIKKSQNILENYFGKKVEYFVPPGNIWSEKTYKAFTGTNIKFVLSNKYMEDYDEEMVGIKFIKDGEAMTAFHDRELKLFGSRWLEKFLKNKI